MFLVSNMRKLRIIIARYPLERPSTHPGSPSLHYSCLVGSDSKRNYSKTFVLFSSNKTYVVPLQKRKKVNVWFGFDNKFKTDLPRAKRPKRRAPRKDLHEWFTPFLPLISLKFGSLRNWVELSASDSPHKRAERESFVRTNGPITGAWDRDRLNGA